MTRELRELERIEIRALGALRFVEAATGAGVEGPLELRALEGRARFVRNRSGRWVIESWSELADHAGAFLEPPELPVPGSLELPIVVTDPSGRFLPRRASLPLPRDPDPENAGEPGSLFRVAEVPLYPAPGSPTGANWALLRVSVVESSEGDALGGTLLLVRRDRGAPPGGGPPGGGPPGGGPPGGGPPGGGESEAPEVLARGLTDGRGEALVAVPGVPVLTFGEDEEAVVVTEIAVTLQAVFDPGAGTRTPAAALRSGAPPPVPVVDPDALEADADALPGSEAPLEISARRSQTITLSVDLP